MGFFDRLTNLSKGWIRQQTRGRQDDDTAEALLDAELARDRAVPRRAHRAPEALEPGPSEAGRPELAPEAEPSASEPPELGPDGAVKRTL